MSFGLFLWKINLIVSVPACFPYLGQATKFVAHWVGPYLSLYILKVFLYFHIRRSLPLVTLWLFIFWGLCEQSSLILCAVLFFCSFQWNVFRCIFESGNMVDSLADWSRAIIACTGSFTLMKLFGVFQLPGSHGAMLLVYLILLSQFSFWKFPFFRV